MEKKKKNDKILQELKDYLDNTPREQLEKDWAETKEKCKGVQSPTVKEFLDTQDLYRNSEVIDVPCNFCDGRLNLAIEDSCPKCGKSTFEEIVGDFTALSEAELNSPLYKAIYKHIEEAADENLFLLQEVAWENGYSFLPGGIHKDGEYHDSQVLYDLMKTAKIKK